MTRILRSRFFRWTAAACTGSGMLFLCFSTLLAAEAVLVHDIGPGPHPRLKYFDQMAADVANRSGGALTISINPGGKVLYPGKASLDAVRTKKAPLTLVNSANLQSVHPSLGMINLPFTVSDEAMLRSGVPERLMDLIQNYLDPAGLKILGLMRGADTILIFRKDKKVRIPEDLKGLKIRVSAPGLYEEIVAALGAQPIVMSSPELAGAMEKGTLDGLVTSPGGWTTVGLLAPHGTCVPGLTFYTYSMIADKAWLEALPPAQRQALIDAGRTCITGNWLNMKNDDRQVLSDLMAKGATYSSIPENELAPWKKKVEGVAQKFADAHPDIMKQFRALVPSGN
jgi:TRAP-type C4-dicarboxylate transport system substrate-binding protein